MATETLTRLLDDMEGGVADETVLFSLDGVEYSIDLKKRNSKKLRDALAPFIEKAERVGGKKKKASSNGHSKVNSAAVRKWAGEHGIEVNPTGRVPQALVDQYVAATS
jgi:hypothetical protein